MYSGMITKSRKFKLGTKIDNLDRLFQVLTKRDRVYARNRVYCTSFFYSWNIRLLNKWLVNGWFWYVEKIEAE